MALAVARSRSRTRRGIRGGRRGLTARRIMMYSDAINIDVKTCQYKNIHDDEYSSNISSNDNNNGNSSIMSNRVFMNKENTPVKNKKANRRRARRSVPVQRADSRGRGYQGGNDDICASSVISGGATTSACHQKQRAMTLVIGPAYDFIVTLQGRNRCVETILSTDSPAVVFSHFKMLAIENFDSINLSSDAMRVLTTPNAGGNSIHSEALSFEVLRRVLGASLVKTEMEVTYRPKSSITDFVVSIAGETIGVSVTRAFKFQKRPEDAFTHGDAERLLRRKLRGVTRSSATVYPRGSWRKQILHVWARNTSVAETLREVYHEIDSELHSDTLVLVTTGDDAEFIFPRYKPKVRKEVQRPCIVEKLTSANIVVTCQG